jgi:hypothetical protein
MSQELQIPSIFQQKGLAKAFQGQAGTHDDSLSDGIGQSFPIISIRGKIWALRYRGERKVVVRPDDGSPSGHLDVVILAAAKNKSKSYYKKYDTNQPEGERPICASLDGIVPDEDVVEKQSDSCALCPRNVWKADPDTGRKGRECTDYKRLAVFVEPGQSKLALGSPLTEPMFLRVPPDSLNSLAIMGDTMKNQGFDYWTFWTRITFDPVKSWPSMIFRPNPELGPVEEKHVPAIMELRNSSSIGRIIGSEIVSQGPKLVQPVVPITATVTPARQQVSEPDTQPKPRGRPPGAKNAPKVEQVVTLAPESNGHTSDEGMSEASDDELDAEIAKLISKK